MVFPKQTHLIPLVTTSLLGMAWSMVKEYASEQSFWQSIPFEYLIAIMLAFWAGLIIQDMQYEESWIWKNIKHHRRVFVIEQAAAIWEATESREWLEIRTKLEFIKDTKNLHIVFRVKSNINSPHAQRNFILHDVKYDKIHKDQHDTFVLGFVPLKSHDGKSIGYQCWGSNYRESGDVKGMESLFDGTENIVEIECKSRWRSQKEMIYLAVRRTLDADNRVLIVHSNKPNVLTIKT